MDTPKEVLQQQFNKVYIHLITQGEKSLSEAAESSNGCSYRGDNGLMCAAGCMIPDEKYTPEMEGFSWDLLCMEYPEAETWLDRELGLHVQLIHDTTEPYRWDYQLRDVAYKFGLSVPYKEEDGNWRTE